MTFASECGGIRTECFCERKVSKRMLQYERVLCPIAFHPNCIEALDVARRCADREAGALYLLHMLRPVDSLEISSPNVAERRLEDGVERLRRIIKEQLPDVNAQPILRSGHPV